MSSGNQPSEYRCVDTLVIGGGLGGMAAALALARAGIQTVVLEARRSRSPDFFGYIIWPPGTRVLEWLGLLDQVSSAGNLLDTFRWRVASGRELARVNVSSYGRFVGVRPSAVDEILSEVAVDAGVEVVLGAGDWTIAPPSEGRRFIDVTDSSGRVVRYAAKVVIGADGPESRLRTALGMEARRWRPPGQAIVTGIGPPIDRPESVQTMGRGWSVGQVRLDHEHSWKYAVIRSDPQQKDADRLPAQAAREWLPDVERPLIVRPSSVRTRRWVADGAVLIGDAAHGMLPHLGLGGSLTLAEIPLLTEVVADAVRDGNITAARLRRFQDRTSQRVGYARRTCEMFALATTQPGLGRLRDTHLAKLGRQHKALDRYVWELSGTRSPSWRTRWAVLLP